MFQLRCRVGSGTPRDRGYAHGGRNREKSQRNPEVAVEMAAGTQPGRVRSFEVERQREYAEEIDGGGRRRIRTARPRTEIMGTERRKQEGGTPKTGEMCKKMAKMRSGITREGKETKRVVDENGRRRREGASSPRADRNLERRVCSIVAFSPVRGLHCWVTIPGYRIMI